MRTLPTTLGAAIALAILAGCAGYTLGPIKPLPMREITTIAVPNFVNETLEPRIEVLVTDTIIKQIQQDGTYSVSREKDADAILEGKITSIDRRAARSVRGNVLATREFLITLRINYTVTERTTGKVLLTRNVSGETSIFVSDQLQQDERLAIPLAAENAAIDLVSQISEGG